MWSVRRRRCRSEQLGAHVSLPCSNVDRTQAVNTLPCDFKDIKDMCLLVSKGKKRLNLPQALLLSKDHMKRPGSNHLQSDLLRSVIPSGCRKYVVLINPILMHSKID